MRKKGLVTRVLMRRLKMCARLKEEKYDVKSIVKKFIRERTITDIRKARIDEMDAHFMEDDIEFKPGLVHIFLGHGENQFFEFKVKYES